MEQRDWMQDQIEQLGRVLGMIIAKFFRLKNEGSLAQAVEITEKALVEQLDINIDELLDMSSEQLRIFMEQHKVQVHYFEQLADYLATKGVKYFETDPKHALLILGKALEMYQIVTVTSSLFSLERAEKEKVVQAQLKLLSNR